MQQVGNTLSEISFNLAVIHVLELEGGYVNDPQDPGGETNYGISKRQYPELDIKKMTMHQAIDIYKKDYWDKHNIDCITNSELAKIVFCTGVNIGMEKAIRYLQEACNIVGAILKEDGIIGMQTSLFVNNFRHQTALIVAYKYIITRYYISLNKKRFIVGWLKRLA